MYLKCYDKNAVQINCIYKGGVILEKKVDVKTLIHYSLLIALTTVMTMVIHIPTPATNGYINLGDMVVFMAAILLGPKGGFVVGGVGSALADLILGYTHYVPITLIVKGLEGFLAGYLLEKEVKPIIATSIAGLFMASGYLLAELFLYGKGAIVSFPGNIVQGLFGAVAAVLLHKALGKTELIKN